jgi:uncharacterized cupredoxin-like copper-binding protein
MDLYSVGAGVSVGNELSKNARDQNQFRIQQNAMLVEHAANVLSGDKQSRKDDTEFKVGMDSYGAAEAIGGFAAQYNKGLTQMATETADNFRTAGNKIANVVGRARPSLYEGAPTKLAQPLTDAYQSSFLAESRAAATGIADSGGSKAVSLTAQALLKPSDVGFTTADDVAKTFAKGLSVGKTTFDGVAEAGSVSRFLLNKVGGITSDVGLEVGGKALGAVGGAISAGQDISNLIDTGHIFKQGESAFSEAGNIGSMVGSALDVASMAVPILAPLALATNVFSAVSSTIGQQQDDKNQIATDSKPPQDQPLSTHPAWSSLGMVASVHSTPQIA